MRLNHLYRPGHYVRAMNNVARAYERVRILRQLREPGGSNSQLDALIHVESNRTNSQRYDLNEIVWW